MATEIMIPQSSARKLARWYDEQLLKKTPVFRGGVYGWIFGLFGQAAVTIAETIHLTRYAPDDLSCSDSIALIGHEMYHVTQQGQMGWWGFLFRYVWHWRPKHIKSGADHPLEKPAYERQREIEQALSDERDP